MSESSKSAGGGSIVHTRSCLPCHRRKIKCDRQYPCTTCIKSHAECAFPSAPITRRRPRRSRARSPAHSSAPTAPNPDARQTPSARSGVEHESLIVNSNGQSRLFAEGSWITSKPNDKDLDEALLAAPRARQGSPTQAPAWFCDAAEAYRPLCVRCACDPSRTGLWRPSSTQLEACWHIFVESIDPIVRILHKPSARKVVDQAMRNGFDSLDKSSVALLLAICFAALIGMDDWRCEALFKESRSSMLDKCRVSLDVAFNEAGLISSYELVTLQAFILYLSCRHRDSSRAIWTLVGVALRIATSLGLHRDGSNFDLPPFQIELRRRIWWQLVLLEVRISEDSSTSGIGVFLKSDTKIPANVPDSELVPEASQSPIPRTGITEMSFTRMRALLCCVFIGRGDLTGVELETDHAAASEDSPLLYTRPGVIDRLQNLIKSDYISYFDREPGVPIFRLGSESGRLIFIKLRLQADLYRINESAKNNSMTEDTRKCLVDTVFENAIELLESQARLWQDPAFQPFHWIMESHVQWHAATFVLSQSCSRLEEMAKASRISGDEAVRIDLEVLPTLLRRALSASEELFKELRHDQLNQNRDKWAFLEKIGQMVRRRVAGTDEGFLMTPTPTPGKGNAFEMDWSALGLDDFVWGADMLNGLDQF